MLPISASSYVIANLTMMEKSLAEFYLIIEKPIHGGLHSNNLFIKIAIHISFRCGTFYNNWFVRLSGFKL